MNRIGSTTFALLMLATSLIAEKGDSVTSAPRRALFDSIALQEMQTLAQALQTAQADTRFFHSLENLDDLNIRDPQNFWDDIHEGGDTPVIDPATARFRSDRVDLRSGFWRWGGPYVTFQQNKTDDADFWNYDRGTPLDPYGLPYYLYTPAGFVRPPSGITGEFYGDAFDRYAIVSHGFDNKFDTNDDLFIFFGGAPTEPTLTGISTTSLKRGETLTARGYNLDAAGVELRLNGTVASKVVEQNGREVTLEIANTDPTGEIRLELYLNGTALAPAYSIFVTPPVFLRSQNWFIYQ